MYHTLRCRARGKMKNFCAICKSKRKCSKHLLLQTQIVHVCLVVVRLLFPLYIPGIACISRAPVLHLPRAPSCCCTLVVPFAHPRQISASLQSRQPSCCHPTGLSRLSTPPPYSLPFGRYGLSNQPQLAINQLPLAIHPAPIDHLTNFYRLSNRSLRGQPFPPL